MGFWTTFGIQAGLSLVAHFLNKKDGSDEGLKSQRDPNEIESRGQVDYDLLFVLGERKVRARVFYQEVEEYTVTTGPHFSRTNPGRGRILHVGANFSQDRTEEATQTTVDDDVFDANGSAGNREELPWKKQDPTADGGIVITGTTRRRGDWKMTFYHLADGSQGSSLRSAAARAVAQHAQNLSFGESSKGYGVSFVHMEFDQPPSGDIRGVEVIAGDPFPVVWDDDNDGPNVELVVKGKHIKMPTRGMSYADFPVEYTANWAAAELWRVHEFEGAELRNINMDSFIDAAEISDTEIKIDATDDLCRVRFAYLATSSDARPQQLAGNAFPPPAPAHKTREAAITALGSSPAHLWYALSFDVDGTWLNWGAWLSLGVVGEAGGTNRAISIRSIRSTSKQGSARVVSYAVDKPSVVVQPFGAPDPNEIDPIDDDDDFDPGDPGPDIDGGVGPLPPDINPGDPEDFYCPQFDRDKTLKLYQIHGVVSSDDSLESIEDEMGFAGSGHVVSDGGVLYAMPGWDRDPIAHVDATDPDVQRISFRSAPPLSERVNAGSVRLANSRAHHWNAYTTPQIIDREQRIRDGKLIHRNFGTRAYVTSPTLANILVRHELAASRPWKIASYRIPIEYSKALRHAVPGNRITLFDPEIDLNPVITRNESNPLFAYGNADGRYMRLLGRSFNFDDDLTMTILVIEHPDGVFAPSLAYPGLEPDPSGPAGFISKPTGLELEEEVYVTEDGNVRSRIIGTSDLASVAERIVQWVPVIPGGIGSGAYTEITTQDGEGNDVVLTETPDFGEPRQFSISGSNFAIDDVRIGITYQVRLIDRSFAGIESAPSDGATITLRGRLAKPNAPTGLSAIGILDGFYLRWTDPEDKDIKNWEVYATTDSIAVPRPSDLIGSPRSPEFVTAGFKLPQGADAFRQRRVWVRALNRSGQFSGYATATVTPLASIEGADGRDGVGFEAIFARWNSSVLPRSKYPSNDWGYDQPQIIDGLQWYDGAPDLSVQNRWLFAAFRKPTGREARIGLPVADQWTVPTIVGYYGTDGLAPPTGLTGVASVGASRTHRQSIIDLSWDAVEGATGYRIIYSYQLGTGEKAREHTNSFDSPINSAKIVVSTALNTDNRIVAQWSITVHTVSEGGVVGGPSDVLDLAGAPLTVSRIGVPKVRATVADSRINLAWSAAEGATRYEVQWRRTTSTLWTTLGTNITALSTFIGAVNAVQYVVRVRGCTGTGQTARCGEWWNSEVLTPTAGAPPVSDTGPGPVTGLAARSTGETTGSASWSAPLDWGSGSNRRYRVTLRSGGVLVSTRTTSSTSINFTGLSSGTSYTVTVDATTSIGDSIDSEASFTTESTAPPDPARWRDWGSFASFTPTLFSDVTASGAEKDGTIGRWSSSSTGLWQGAGTAGVFAAYTALVDGSSRVIQCFQSQTNSGNNMRRTDTNSYIGTSLALLNPSGDNVDNYRSRAFDFVSALHTFGHQGTPPFPAGSRGVFFLEWERDSSGSETGTQSIYVVTSTGVQRAQRRYQ